jgi:hypothetical protein
VVLTSCGDRGELLDCTRPRQGVLEEGARELAHWTGCRRAAAGASRTSCSSYSSDSGTVHPASMLWYGDGRQPACVEAPARDRWVVRGSPYGAAPGPMRRLVFLEGWRKEEPAARGSRQWGNGPARTPRQRGGRCAAGSAARPPALWSAAKQFFSRSTRL